MDKAFAAGGCLGGVRAAFGRTSLPGSVFIEATGLGDVRRACLGLIAKSDISRARMVSMHEALAPLRVSVGFTPASPAWIRLSRGLYKDDLAFVADVDSRTLQVRALVVPRIPLDPPAKKMKCKLQSHPPRPPRQAFDCSLVGGIYGPNSIVRLNQVHRFKGNLYKNGLLELSLDRYQFRTAFPTYQELEAFCHCPDIDIGVMAEAYTLAGQATLQLGDRVKIVSGQHKGLVGLVRQVSPDEVQVDTGLTLKPILATLLANAVRKHFEVGDEVKVRSGKHGSLTGWVVGVGGAGNGISLDICEHTSKSVVRGFTTSMHRN